MYNTYDPGDLVRMDVEITISGSYVNPNHLALYVRNPNGNIFHFIYGATGTFINDGVGKYHLDIFADDPGQWAYKFFSSGTAWGAEEQVFVIRRPKV